MYNIYADLVDPVSSAIMEHSSHPSIKSIKERCRVTNSFQFTTVTEDLVKMDILQLNANKKVSGSMPIKVLKLATSECAPVLTKCFNDALVHAKFPDERKSQSIKRETQLIKQIIDLSVYYQLYPRFMKG